MALMTILGVAVLLALLAPFWMLFRTRALPAADRTRRRARRTAACSVAAAGLTALALSNWSFSLGLLNVLVAAGAFAASGALIVHAFGLEPRPAWIAIGLLDAAMWCVALLFTLLSAAAGHGSSVPADLGGGLYCRDASHGFFPSDAVYEFDIFRRHGFVDHQIYTGSLFDDDGDRELPAPPHLREPVARCRALLDQRREAPAVANQANRAYTPAVAPHPGTDDER